MVVEDQQEIIVYVSNTVVILLLVIVLMINQLVSVRVMPIVIGKTLVMRLLLVIVLIMSVFDHHSIASTCFPTVNALGIQHMQQLMQMDWTSSTSVITDKH
jgi:hypothetical protein